MLNELSLLYEIDPTNLNVCDTPAGAPIMCFLTITVALVGGGLT
jgi:hypothetical protein